MRKAPAELYGLSISEIARICDVDSSTARRWKRGASCPPRAALLLLRRDLGCFSAEWSGWTIEGPDLIAPHGWRVRRDDALAVPLLHGQISALRADLRALKGAAALAEQPLPASWPDWVGKIG